MSADLRGSMMVCGTASDAGKSVMVAGLCRLLHRRGIRVSPFKAQNMSLNSYVTSDGGEIGRAQASQAMAAGAEPEVAMNPVLLKPTSFTQSQVIVRGEVLDVMDASDYYGAKHGLMETVCAAFEELADRYDVVIAEGAGNPAEINLAQHDIVNLGLARRLGIPAILVGDIDRGGVFASLFGTVSLLPPQRRACLRGLIINKFRGAMELLDPGLEEIGRLCGVPVLGTVPFVDGLTLDAEDSLSLAAARINAPRANRVAGPAADALDVAVVALPHLSNFTDFDPLGVEEAVALRFVEDPRLLGVPDLVVLPGTKTTVADLGEMRRNGMVGAVMSAHREGSVVLGICGGFQMLGAAISDAVESGCGDVEGLGLLDMATTFDPGKVTRRRTGSLGRWALGSPPVSGYEIHHGRSKVADGAIPFAVLHDGAGTENEGAVSVNRRVFGTSLHGFLEDDAARAAFLYAVATVRSKRFAASASSFAAQREAQFDRLADVLETALDLGAIERIVAEGGRSGKRIPGTRP